MEGFCKIQKIFFRGKLPTWIASGKGQNRVLMLGEKKTAMGKPSTLKMLHTMLTNKAVGE